MTIYYSSHNKTKNGVAQTYTVWCCKYRHCSAYDLQYAHNSSTSFCVIFPYTILGKWINKIQFIEGIHLELKIKAKVTKNPLPYLQTFEESCSYYILKLTQSPYPKLLAGFGRFTVEPMQEKPTMKQEQQNQQR